MFINNGKIDQWAATAMVIANMVGTGVFTSLGFQLLDIQNAWSISALWLLGGIIALCGAFVYAEIGSIMVSNGGEYLYLSKIYHPALGFSAGIVSILVGFSAPIAAACVAFGKYFSYTFTSLSSYDKSISIIILILIGSIHLLSIKIGTIFQKYITLIKIIVILLFFSAFFNTNANIDLFQLQPSSLLSDVFSSSFAISLIYVSYAYSGWNAASYVAGEIINPQKNLSKALIVGTLTVMVFYVLLNISFIYSTPVNQLKGNVEVGVISAGYIFGKKGGDIIGAAISLLLISTINSMFIAAPRVVETMGNDYRALKIFSHKNQYQSPYLSVIAIVISAGIMIISSTFEWLINFIGITLIIFTTLTVSGIFLIKKNKKHNASSFKVPFYPITPLFFIASNLWILIYVSFHNPSAFYLSLGIIFTGIILHFSLNKNES